jgi:AcrR family transcriptional regulator
MAAISDTTRAATGLRERKKARTRAAIQRHALRLFREQGYDATTVEQIAAAAEVSPSTFFRYFPTKEDVVLYDDLDPLLFAAFEAQPPDLTPIQAMRRAVREAFSRLPAVETDQQWERARLMLSVPELRRRMLEQFADLIEVCAQLLATRAGRRADELDVRIFAGALIGSWLAVFFAAGNDPHADFLALLDESMRYLEAGMPL